MEYQISHVEPLYGEEEKQAVQEYLSSGGYLTEYKKTEELEQALAEFLGVKHVSMVPSGYAALYLSLLASGIGPGDKVLVPDYTMIATPNAVRAVGAEPVLVDIEEETGCMDLLTITQEAKAMIYVEINGQSSDMWDVRRYCEANNMILIEDSCQSLGGRYGAKKLGTFGKFGCFSLGFHKIITTGQGGFIVSKHKKDYEAIERLKDYGRIEGGNDEHDHYGMNYKFTDLQAVIGLEQLKSIDWRMEQKRNLYRWFWNQEPPDGYVPWFLEVMADHRDRLHNKLAAMGIGTRKLYPPIHTQAIYPDGDFPVATHVCSRGLWLPSSLNLTEEDVTLIKKEVYANI